MKTFVIAALLVGAVVGILVGIVLGLKDTKVQRSQKMNQNKK